MHFLALFTRTNTNANLPGQRATKPRQFWCYVLYWSIYWVCACILPVGECCALVKYLHRQHCRFVTAYSDGQFASFIDDTKMWTKVSEIPTLVTMANELTAFNSSVGQNQNDQTSAILTRKKENADRFLLQVGNISPRLNKPTLLVFTAKYPAPKVQNPKMPGFERLLRLFRRFPIFP